MKQILVILMWAFCCMTAGAQSNVTKRQTTTKKVAVQKSTTTSTPVDYDKLLVGNHMLSLQWISWEKFGKATITKTDTPNVYSIFGMQDGAICSDEEDGRKNADYLMIEGTITPKSKTRLVFEGKIIQKVHHINGGMPCVREGTFIFLSTQGRRYWRMQEMKNPCDECTDYVDIYFK